MSVDTKTRVVADLPQVNLLPPEIGDRRRLQQVQLVGAVALVGAIAAVGVLYTSGAGEVKKAKQQVTAANVENAALTRSVATFGRVRQVKSDRDAHEAMLTQAMSSEIQWSNYLGGFATLPTSTWLKSMTLSETLAPGSLSSATQAPPVVGTASFAATGLNYASLADWLDRVARLGEQNGLTAAYFSTATEAFIDNTKVVNFAGTAGLSSVALSGRCTKPGDC